MIVGDRILTAGNKVARLGEHFRLTQQKWADLVGVDRGTIAAYKHRDNASPATERVRELSNTYGVPISWFYDGEDSAPPVPTDHEEAKRLAADGKVKALKTEQLSREQAEFSGSEDVALPVWKGAVAGFNDECLFTESDDPPLEVPGFFVAGRPDRHIVCLPSGVSMSPRIMQGDWVIVRLEDNPAPNSIIIARRSDGVNFIKVFRMGKEMPELHSINDRFPVITVADSEWTTRGVVVGIWKPYMADGPNIEYAGGMPLRA